MAPPQLPPKGKGYYGEPAAHGGTSPTRPSLNAGADVTETVTAPPPPQPATNAFTSLQHTLGIYVPGRLLETQLNANAIARRVARGR